jgi:hypothetical protein
MVWFDRLQVTILSLKGRVKLPFEIAEYYHQYLHWKNTSADLLQDRKGRWWLHVVMIAEGANTVLIIGRR